MEKTHKESKGSRKERSVKSFRQTLEDWQSSSPLKYKNQLDTPAEIWCTKGKGKKSFSTQKWGQSQRSKYAPTSFSSGVFWSKYLLITWKKTTIRSLWTSAWVSINNGSRFQTLKWSHSSQLSNAYILGSTKTQALYLWRRW